MTSHIAAICSRTVIVVGDRLLTTQSNGAVDAWDERSNKTIVALTQHSVFTVSYAGLAHIAGKNTDEWLVDVMTEVEQPPTNGKRALMHSGSSLVGFNLGSVRSRIIAGVGRDFTAIPGHEQSGLQVLIAGWGWGSPASDGRPIFRTVLNVITHDTVNTSPGYVSYPRIVGGTPIREFRWQSIGHRVTRVPTITSYLQSGRFSDEGLQMAILEEVRGLAAKPQSTVGAECMAVMMSLSQKGPIVTFFREPTSPPEGDTYWPAVIHYQGEIANPSQATCSDNGTSANGVKFVVQPPCPPKPGIHRHGGQPRRPIA